MKILKNEKNNQGFSLLELLIIVLVIAIIGVAALPRIMSSRQVFYMFEAQKQIVSALREARQEAMSQKKQIIFYYDDTNKNIIIGGGNFGDIGNAENKVVSIIGDSLSPRDLVYGHPISAASTTLGDGSSSAPLTGNKLKILFQSDGSVADEDENVQNQAMFFYNLRSPDDSAFAISVLGTGGRVKAWQYNKQKKSYIE